MCRLSSRPTFRIFHEETNATDDNPRPLLRYKLHRVHVYSSSLCASLCRTCRALPSDRRLGATYRMKLVKKFRPPVEPRSFGSGLIVGCFLVSMTFVMLSRNDISMDHLSICELPFFCLILIFITRIVFSCSELPAVIVIIIRRCSSCEFYGRRR